MGKDDYAMGLTKYFGQWLSNKKSVRTQTSDMLYAIYMQIFLMSCGVDPDYQNTLMS